MQSSPPLLQLQFQMMLPSMLSVNVPLPALLLILLLVLLHTLSVLLLSSPLRTPTTAGNIATTGIKLSVAMPPFLGSGRNFMLFLLVILTWSSCWITSPDASS